MAVVFGTVDRRPFNENISISSSRPGFCRLNLHRDHSYGVLNDHCYRAFACVSDPLHRIALHFFGSFPMEVISPRRQLSNVPRSITTRILLVIASVLKCRQFLPKEPGSAQVHWNRYARPTCIRGVFFLRLTGWGLRKVLVKISFYRRF